MYHLGARTISRQHDGNDMEPTNANPPIETETPPAPPPAPPPSAALVIHGTKSEREIELERRLEDSERRLNETAAEKRARELRVAELERDVQELKQIPTRAPNPRRPKIGPIPIFWRDDET